MAPLDVSPVQHYVLVVFVLVLLALAVWAVRTALDIHRNEQGPPGALKAKPAAGFGAARGSIDVRHEAIPTADLNRHVRLRREAYTQAFDVALMLDERTHPLADRAVAIVMTRGTDSAQQLAQLVRHENDLFSLVSALRSYAQKPPGADHQMERALIRLERPLGLLAH